MKKETQKEYDPIAALDEMVKNAKTALDEYMKMDQAQVDKIGHAMALAGVDQHMPLAKMAVEETTRGVVEDKVIKNIFATEYVWNYIKDTKTVGIIEENEAENYIAVADPVGVVAAVTPVTNPTSTTMFKAIVCAKARNPVIFAFHPSAQKCSAEAARVVRDAAIAAGAPKNCVQWIEVPSMDATSALMNHKGVSLILATGGPGLVKAAYSCGKPALGVGAGNVPCYINKNVNVRRAATDLMISKTFDNGMICASEQAVIIDKEIAKEFESFMTANGCHFLTPAEIKKIEDYVVLKSPEGKVSINPKPVGQTAHWVASQAGVKVAENTKILLAKQPKPGYENPLTLETLMPLIAYIVVDGPEQGFAYSKKMLEIGGLGHTAVIHTDDKELIKQFGIEMMAGRVVCNQPSSQGAIGDIYSEGIPSLTLGCGSYGKNSTSHNVSTVNLMNVKRVSQRRKNMQWFKIPPKIYFEKGSVQYLQDMPKINRAFIVTDPMMAKLGYVDKVLAQLKKRSNNMAIEVFTDVEPDPSVTTVLKGAAAMRLFQPDVIISLGGGSAIDAAKGMWLFYEQPDISFDSIRLKFLDIRKRAFRFPKLGEKAQFVAIPTTSGTGSEVTSFTVITDKEKGIKYPLADYELTPDVAIIDAQFVATMPSSIVADTGLDVLTHAIEAYVSILASDYSDGLAMKAIELIFKYLPRSFASSNDFEAREKVHNASCIAGMAFTNAFLGINHSLAHKLGGEFHLPHGRANALILPYVIEYNAGLPDKFPVFPKAEEFKADEKYADISNRLRFGGKDTAGEVKALIDQVWKLMETLGMPTSIKDCGIDEKEYFAAIPKLAEMAFEDQCTTANPRYPLIKDLEEIYKRAWLGKKGR